jgi:hypothetical protein
MARGKLIAMTIKARSSKTKSHHHGLGRQWKSYVVNER